MAIQSSVKFSLTRRFVTAVALRRGEAKPRRARTPGGNCFCP
jgi:hypothetical protein